MPANMLSFGPFSGDKKACQIAIDELRWQRTLTGIAFFASCSLAALSQMASAVVHDVKEPSRAHIKRYSPLRHLE